MLEGQAYQLAAETVLTAHFAFILFVVFGGLLVRWWPRLAWLHLPALVWGSLVNLTGRVCPLTPLENHFRAMAGEAGYQGNFIEEYIAPFVYPGAMTRELEILAGASLPAWNVAVYTWVWWCLRQERRAT